MQNWLAIPKSLHDVSMNVAAGADYPSAMKEFIDVVIRDLQAKDIGSNQPLPVDMAMLTEEPVPLAEPVHRAHLGGMAEHLASLAEMAPPDWCEKEAYFLKEPVVLAGPAARERTLTETPAAFRRRLLFCGRVLVKLEAMLAGRRA